MDIKKFAVLVFVFWVITSYATCSFLFNRKYREGDPIIVNKQSTLLPNTCVYTYEGWGKKVDFEDYCWKYSIGDKLTD